MGQRLSPSRMALAEKCLYTFREDVTLPPDKSGPEALAGKAAHAAIETLIRDGSVTDDLPPSFLPWLEASGLSHETHDLTVELPIVYDHARGTSRVVELLPNGRMPPTSDDEMPCMIDLVAVPRDGGPAIVIDWKTGKPKDFGWQMLTYALAFNRLRDLDVEPVTALVVYVHADRTWQDMPMVFDSLDLDVAEQTIRDARRRLPMAQPTPGKHCRDQWCRLRETCGARREWEKQNRKAA